MLRRWLRRWLGPNAAGAVLLLFFLCVMLTGTAGVEIDGADTSDEWSATLGVVPLLDLSHDAASGTSIDVHWLALLGVLAIGWLILMPIGRLMIDGGVRPDRGPALRPRRHPAIILLADVPIAMLLGALVATAAWKFRWFDSPNIEGATWRNMFVIFSVLLFILTTPIVALWLVIRRLLDRRRASLSGFPVELVGPPVER